MQVGMTGLSFASREVLRQQLQEALADKGKIQREFSIAHRGNQPQRIGFVVQNGRPDKTMTLVEPESADRFTFSKLLAARQFVGLDKPTRRTAEDTRHRQAASKLKKIHG